METMIGLRQYIALEGIDDLDATSGSRLAAFWKHAAPHVRSRRFLFATESFSPPPASSLEVRCVTIPVDFEEFYRRTGSIRP